LRAIIRAGNDYCVRSRRGWLMTELLPEFATLNVRGVFDGEPIAFGDDKRPSFHRLCARMLNHDASVPVALVLFDVLELDGESRPHLPYPERRELLEDTYFRFLTRTDNQPRAALDAYDMREATG
jgi:bifunctional non-homologous end joining protein LigD